MRISIVMTILIVLSLFVQVPKAQSSNYTYVIPDESIRLRILAHSDEESDQRMKLQVRDKVNQYISEKIFEAEQIDDARIIVQENISELEQLLTDLIERPFTIE